MTSDEVKAIYRAKGTNVDTLRALIAQGIEYPDAVWKIGNALKLKPEERAEMTDAYDNET
jgi:hypothetical protein